MGCPPLGASAASQPALGRLLHRRSGKSLRAASWPRRISQWTSACTASARTTGSVMQTSPKAPVRHTRTFFIAIAARTSRIPHSRPFAVVADAPSLVLEGALVLAQYALHGTVKANAAAVEPDRLIAVCGEKVGIV
jgi:hypothetical protein